MAWMIPEKQVLALRRQARLMSHKEVELKYTKNMSLQFQRAGHYTAFLHLMQANPFKM